MSLCATGEFCSTCGWTIEWDGHSELAHVKAELARVRELAWAAGFFDGEGTVSQTSASGTRRRYLLIRIGHVDPRPLHRFAAAAGGDVRGPYQQRGGEGRWSDYYVWQRAGAKAQETLDRLIPYLSPAKLEQLARVEEVIASTGRTSPSAQAT